VDLFLTGAIPLKRVSWFEVVRDYLVSAFYELVADFTEDLDREDGLADDKELSITQFVIYKFY